MYKLYIFSILITTNLGFSQYYSQWVQRYNGPLNSVDGGSMVLADTLGNIYVFGASAGVGYDFCCIKYSPEGNQLLVIRYNSPGNGTDSPTGAFVDKQMNIYITGRSDSSLTGSDFMTVKYNSSGTLRWAVRYTSSGNNDDLPLGVIADDTGNVYVGGNVASGKTNIIKYDSNGVLKWNKIHTSSIDGHFAYDFTVDRNFNFYFNGYVNHTVNVTDYYTLKFSQSGDLIWSRTYNGSANLYDDGYFVEVDSKLNVITTGYSNENNGSFINTIKYDSSGNQLWIKRLNNNGQDVYIAAMMVDSYDNIFFTGSTFVTGNNYNYYTAKIDSAGIVGWTTLYNGTGNGSDVPYSIRSDSQGRTIVCGGSLGISTAQDYCTVVYNSSGNQIQELRYNGPGNGDDIAISVLFNNFTNSLVVTGSSTGSTNNRDFCTINYGPTVNIEPNYTEQPANFSLQQNFPNPFNPVTNIKFSIPKPSLTIMKVFDITGKEISTLFERNLSAGYYETDFNASDLSSGIYFYKLITEDFTQSKNMVLIK